jgi:secondary thiamine-phosphate synthase enzyme
MPIINGKITLQTQGFTDIIDITNELTSMVLHHAIKTGQMLVYVPGSTVSVTSIEYEPGLIKDLPEILEKLIPMNQKYHHDEKWQDGNGYAHVRASIIGNDINIPIMDGELILGTWQNVVLIDFDNKPRARKVFVQIVTEDVLR